MYKFLHLAAPALAILLLLSGCETAERDLDTQIERSNDSGSGQIDTPADQNGTISMQPGDGGSVSDDNTTVGEIKIDAKNAYRVAVTFSDNYNANGYFYRGEIGRIHFDITNLYTGAPAAIENIDEIILEAEEKNSETDGKYFNFITYSGEEGPRYIIPKNSIKASDDVALKVKDLSGNTNIIFKATIRLKEGTSSTYSLKVPLVIEKNKSSSMAIVPFEDRYENGLFIKKFVIHVVDTYGNKAKDGTRISTGVINNPKIISNEGTLDQNKSEFTLNPLDQITTANIQVTDTLVTLANQQEYRPENLGGWDITDIMPQESKLKIITWDRVPEVNHIKYVIGNEYRYDRCNDTVMNAAASTFESTEVKDGIAFAELRYVPAMVGKTVTIYANTRLNDKRIGISRVVALTGTGLQPVTISCTNDAGKQSYCNKTVTFIQNDSEKFAREALIGHPINTGDAEHAQINFPNGFRTDCNGHLQVEITNIDENKTASYTMGVVSKAY